MSEVQVIRDIWVCQDCVQAAVNGDFSGLDYVYDEKEAAQREAAIVAGLEALPGLVADFGGDEQLECRDCGFIHSRDHFARIDIGEEDGGPSTEYQCPECQSIETKVRDSGEDEFSRSECDCCGDHLAGSRYRMAQLISEEVAS